jgi:hypothetical protein
MLSFLKHVKSPLQFIFGKGKDKDFNVFYYILELWDVVIFLFMHRLSAGQSLSNLSLGIGSYSRLYLQSSAQCLNPYHDMVGI